MLQNFLEQVKGLDGRTVQIDGWRDYDVVENILKKCTNLKKKTFKVLKKSPIKLNKLKKIIFYSYSKCSTCRKASNWLDQKNIKYQLIDIVQETP